jgi:hypothetical protein
LESYRYQIIASIALITASIELDPIQGNQAGISPMTMNNSIANSPSIVEQYLEERLSQPQSLPRLQA